MTAATNPNLPTPYFLLGAVRSGTTLLRLMLDHHPRLVCFGEFEYAVDLLDATQRWPSGSTYAKWLAEERRFIASGLTVDPSQSYSQIAHGIFDTLTGRRSSSAVAVGASVHRHFDRLDRLWPDAKYVYLVRDGRDVARSCVSMGWAGNVWSAARYWEIAEDTWRAFRDRMEPNRWIEVRNEALIEDTDSCLTDICHHLGTDYHDEMLSYPQHTTYGLPDPGLIQQWKHKLSRRERRWLDSRLGDRLDQRGYHRNQTQSNSIGISEQAYLKIQNAIGKHRFRIHRFGFPLWATELVARKLRLRSLERATRRRTRQIALQHLK